MAYDRINWENTPSTNTPLNADNLNTMDAALANLDNLITTANELITQLQGYIDLLNARIDTVVVRPEGATGLINVTDGNATGSVLTIGAIDSVEYPLGNYAFAEGQNTIATGIGSHAEGTYTKALGGHSHAEGEHTTAATGYSHAEGSYTTTTGLSAHAEGLNTTASGNSSHAEGTNTIAAGSSQHAFGKYNIEDANDTYAEIVGNGTNSNNRSNARTLDWQGNEAISGSLTVGKGSASEATLTPIMVGGLRFFHIEGTTLTINSHPLITIEEDIVDDGEIWTSGP